MQLTLMAPTAGNNGARPGPALSTLPGLAPAPPVPRPTRAAAPAVADVPAPITPAPEPPAAPKAKPRTATAKKTPAKKRAAKKPTPGDAQAPARARAGKAKGRSVSEEHVFAVAGYAVALAAVLVSLSHMYDVAHLAGQSWRSFLLPVSVDGLALVSVMAVRRCRRQGLTPDRLVIGSLVLSVAASLAANVIASDPSLVDEAHMRWVVGAWPPVAFLLAELVIKQWHRAGAGVPSTSRPGASPNPTSKPRGPRAS